MSNNLTTAPSLVFVMITHYLSSLKTTAFFLEIEFERFSSLTNVKPFICYTIYKHDLVPMHLLS